MDRKGYFSSEIDYWETPKLLFDALDEEFNFNLDPCSTDENAKCEMHFTKKEDGLRQNWGGHRVFCNPPYGKQETGKWVEKAYKESQKENTLVVMLIPARTDTIWFHKYIYGKAEIRFIKGRVKFDLNGMPRRTSTAPSMIVIMGDRNGTNNHI